MAQVKTIDRTTLQNTIRPKLVDMLKKLSEELGIEITATHGTYGGTTGTFKLEMAMKSEDGTVMTRERKAFLEMHRLYKLPAEALDAVIESGGTKLRIIGLNTRASKNNVLLECMDGSGKHRVAPADVVLALYERQTMKKTG